jgi:cysteine desulfurase / selenocysteine lyase
VPSVQTLELASLRRDFPVTERWVYLNHAGIAPLPRRAAQRAAASLRRVVEGGDRAWAAGEERGEEVRALAARLLGARRPREVAFVPNTSTGLSLVAQGLEWRAGDNVVGALSEFPANVYPWMELGHRGVEYRQLRERSGRLDLDELASLVDERTRAVALSWVQYASGFRVDLSSLGRFCRERGALLVVDAIQGLGAVRMDVERDLVDVAVAGGHKWLLGPQGIGLLYVSERVVHRIRPVILGWRSVRHPFDWATFDPTLAEAAARFEPGSFNVAGVDALGASLELLLELGPETVEARVLALASRVADGLAARGFEVVSSRRPGEASGVVAALHGEVPAEELVAKLAGRGVVAAARGGRLRVSPHVYNTEEEIDRFLEALE